MISLSNVNLKYDNQIVFDKASICIHHAKITSIIGSSGSGKTSLLNMIDLISSNKDYVYLYDGNEIDVTNDGVKSKLRSQNMVYMTQDVTLIDHMSVHENMLLLSKQRNISKIDAQDVLDKVSLDIELDTLVSTLSRGQKQRLIIASALISQSSILILDEPTSALDQKNKEDLLKLIKKIVLEENLTVIIATHDKSVKDYADYVYEIKNKKISLLVSKTFENDKYKKTKSVAKNGLKNLFLYNLSYEMKHLIVTLSLLFVSAVVIGFGSMYLSLGIKMTGIHTAQINSINDNTTKIEKIERSSNDMIQDTFYAFSDSDVSLIESVISQPEKLVPFYRLDSIYYDATNVKANLEGVLTYKGIPYTYRNLSIQPFLDEQKVREELCEQISEPGGIYVPAIVAQELNMDLSTNNVISLNQIALAMYDLELIDKETREKRAQTLSKDISLDNLHISGILSNDVTDLYSTKDRYIIYMSISNLESIYNHAKSEFSIDSFNNDIEHLKKHYDISSINELNPSIYLYEGTFSELEIKEVQALNPLFSVSLSSDTYHAFANEVKTGVIYGLMIVIAIEMIASFLIIITYIFRFKTRAKEIVLLKIIGYSHKDINKMLIVDSMIKTLIIYFISILAFILFRQFLSLPGCRYGFVVLLVSLLLSAIPSLFPTVYSCFKCKRITIEKIR